MSNLTNVQQETITTEQGIKVISSVPPPADRPHFNEWIADVYAYVRENKVNYQI